MARKEVTAFDRLPGLRWMENGQCALSGAFLDLDGRLDDLFLAWAARSGAVEHRFPILIAADELAKIGYFASFPQLVTFPVTLAADDENLQAFAEANIGAREDGIRLAATAPIRDVLAPAACYPIYIQFQGQRLAAPQYLTVRSTCFRRETYYAPLERQWSFSMREIVCLGTADEVREFLAGYRERIGEFFRRAGLAVAWKDATDPFFRPDRSAKHLMQVLDPVKQEIVFEDRLAIGSINFHQDAFGRAFALERNGEPAYSGCVAFGIERWMRAWIATFGPDPRGWADPRCWQD